MQHKNKRLDAQYYMRVGKEGQVKIMLKEAKIFVADFDTFVSNLTNEEIQDYRTRFRLLIK